MLGEAEHFVTVGTPGVSPPVRVDYSLSSIRDKVLLLADKNCQCSVTTVESETRMKCFGCMSAF